MSLTTQEAETEETEIENDEVLAADLRGGAVPDHANPEKPPGEKCVTVVFNPVSGQTDPEVRKTAIREALAEHGYRCQELITTPEKGARHFAEEALKEGVDLLAVSGGDGTVMEVMTACVGTGVPVAIFPAGTGNLLSVNLGLPKEVRDAVHSALFGERRALDLARVTIPDNASEGEPKYFAILAGAGYDAWVIRDADREAKNKFGLFAYLWAALKNLRRRPVSVRIRLDDEKRTMRRRAKSVMVANMGRLQAGVEVVPDAHPDDGVLELAILEAENVGDWLRLAFNAVRGKLRDDPSVEYRHVRKVAIEMSVPMPMQFDGEESDKRHRAFTVEVVPSAVEVMVPKTSPV
jgi:YegS/Rv2252/BmrU family lipid kinase